MACCGGESKAPRLTLGVAVYDDFRAAAMTVQAARLGSGLDPREIEVVIVDNRPDSSQGKALADLCVKGNCRYVPFAEPVGTSAPRDAIFRHATAPVVCVVDSHVVIDGGALRRLVEHAESVPESRDLWHGPMLDDSLGVSATHLDPDVWGEDLSLGKWRTDPAILMATEPVEIPAMGLGLFACRREAWPGFPSGLRGFGGEECLVHDLVRQRGGRVLCLPWLRWWHLFRRFGLEPLPYSADLIDRCTNYLVWCLTLGRELADVERAFVHGPQRRLSPEQFAGCLAEAQRVTADARPSLPLVSKATAYAAALARHVAAGRPRVAEPEYNARIETCRLCPRRKGAECLACGCPIDAKALWGTERCPEGRWERTVPLPAGVLGEPERRPRRAVACRHPVVRCLGCGASVRREAVSAAATATAGPAADPARVPAAGAGL